MNKKAYQTINKFVQQLSDAEDMWRISPTTSDKLVATLTQVLSKNGFGKTDEELIDALLKLAASIVTKPETADNYPAINFIENGKDN